MEAMTTAALITKLKKKLDKETDKGILKSIDILLQDSTKEAREKQRMMEAALRSEEDAKKGRVMSGAEARKRMKEHLELRKLQREQTKEARRA